MPTFQNFAGLNNRLSPERLAAGDLVEAINVDIDASGRLSRRAGYRQVLAGSFHSLYAGASATLLAGGTTLYRLWPGYTTSVLRAGLTPNARLSCAEQDGRLYYSNGHETGVIDHGTARSWGLAVPAHQGVANATHGTLPAGRYQWALTYVRSDGQESGATVAGVIELAAPGGLAWSDLPVSADPGVGHKLLYLSAANGSVLYETQLLLNTATQTQLLAPRAGATPLQTQFLGPPPAGHLVALAHGRTFVAVDNRLYYSEPLGYELFDARRYFTFGGRITLLADIDAGLVVSAGDATGVLLGTDPEDWTWSVRNGDAAIPGTLAYAPGHALGDGALGEATIPLWLASSGVCLATPDGQVRNLTTAHYHMSESGQGAAAFMPDHARYVAVVNR